MFLPWGLIVELCYHELFFYKFCKDKNGEIKINKKKYPF